MRGDDGAGPYAASLLDGVDGITVAISRGDLQEVLDALRLSKKAVVIDACRSNVAPGTVHRLTV